MRKSHNIVYVVRVGAAILAAMLIVSGCEEKAPTSLYENPLINVPKGPAPVITGIEPQDSALGGVTTLTVTGSNFYTDVTKDLLFFETSPAFPQQATPTQLTLVAPLVFGDSVKVKIAVQGADFYSNIYSYKIVPAVETWGGFKVTTVVTEEPVGAATDASGIQYVSIIGSGVWRVSRDGARMDSAVFSPVYSSQVPLYTGMKVGPGGAVFAVGSKPGIFRIPPAGGAAGLYKSSSSFGNLADLDFDAQGDIWTGGVLTTGPGVSISRVKTSDLTIKQFPFAGSVHSIRVFSGYLYVAAKRDSLEKIWRLPIASPDSLGPEEVYFNLSDPAVFGPNSYGAYAITFASDGTLFIGTDAPGGVIVVSPSKSWGVLYPGLISPKNISFAWGSGPNLFTARTQSGVPNSFIRINTQMTSAPYYGQGL